MKTFVALTAALCVAGYTQANAAIIYTSQASFDAVVTQAAGSGITFEGLDTSGGSFTNLGGAYNQAGLTFSDVQGVYANKAGFGAFNDDTTTDFYGGGGEPLTITLPTGASAVNAFGAYFISAADGTTEKADITVTFSDGSTLHVTPSFNPINNSFPTSFYGITSGSLGVSITSIVFGPNDFDNGFSNPGIDNVEFGTSAATVPEPSTYALLLSGACALFAFARRRAVR